MLLVITSFLSVACLVQPVHAEVLKMGTVAPEGTPWHDALLELAQQWKEISNGKITLRIYGGGVAGDEPDMLRKMRIGQLHGAAMTTMNLIGMTPDVEAISFPTLVRTDEELDHVIGKVGPLLEAQLADKGYKVLSWTSTGWIRFFSKEPVVIPDDLQKQKLFFWGTDAIYIEFLKNVGFQPVPLAVTDMLPSLQTGLVDAFAAPPTAALAFQWFGLAKNMTDMPWQPVPGVILLSNKKWQRIPEDQQQQMMAAAERIGARLLERTRGLEQEALDAMVEHGLIIHPVPPETAALWRQLMREKGMPVFVGPRFSRDMFDRVQKALDEYRSGKAD